MLSILLLEDNPTDARLIADLLAADGLEASIERVETRPAFEAALLQEHFQIILSDYCLPAFDGITALALARERRPELPFILVSGTLGEENAVESLRAGASDYVLKQRLNRLAPVVRRALSEAEEHRRRRQAELALRESQRLYQSLVEQLPQAIFRLDRAGRTTFVNSRYCELLGRSRDELLGKTDFDLFPAELAAKYWADSQRVLESGCLLEAVEHHRRPDGSDGFVHVVKSPLRDGVGQIVGVQCLFWDVTDQQQAEAALEASERKHRLLFVSSREAIMTLAPPDWRFTSANPATLEMFRVASEVEFLAIHPWDLSPERQPDGRLAREKAAELIAQAMREGSHKFEWLHRRLGGEEFFAEVLLTRMEQDGQPALQACARDITERKLAERERLRLATALEQSAETIVITDPQGTIQYVNPAFEKITGYTRAEALGQNPRLLKSGRHDAEFYRQMWATLRRGEVWRGRMTNKRKDGALFEESATISPVLDAAGQVVNYIALKLDVTRASQLESQLQQAQKLEVIGRLAGGVAHDFNNILTAIFIQASLCGTEEALPAEARSSLADIKQAAERAANLTRQLLLFSRQQALQPRVLDLNTVVGDLNRMLRRILGEAVHLRLHLCAQPLRTLADAGMLDQVLLNLAVNARDAMPGGGQLTLETGHREVAAAQPRPHPDAEPGRYVWLRVSDTGSGISPDVLPHIFEPFFTTKEIGRGTGLGLATVFGIVKQHRGWIEVQSAPAQGTVFQVHFPATTAAPAASPVAPARSVARPAARGGTETILLVEDEPVVRLAIRVFLERQGYRVLDAVHGLAALSLAQAHGGDIALLLTDLVIPEGLDGRKLAAQLQGQIPALKVVFMSGHSPELTGCELPCRPQERFLQKPFSPQRLLETLRDCLES